VGLGLWPGCVLDWRMGHKVFCARGGFRGVGLGEARAAGGLFVCLSKGQSCLTV
jgi:hypothetical protein